MSKQMFFFTGVYETVAQAEADYDAIKSLHKNDDIGSYDAAVLTKSMDGKVKVHKDEKPTRHGAAAGAAAGAGAAILFPPLLLVTWPVAIGTGVGAWMGHIAHGMSRKDAKQMAEMLQPGQAALVVIGIDEDAARIEEATGSSISHMTKHLEGSNFDEAEQEAMEAAAAQTA